MTTTDSKISALYERSPLNTLQKLRRGLYSKTFEMKVLNLIGDQSIENAETVFQTHPK